MEREPVDVEHPTKPRPPLSPLEQEPRGIPAERPELAPIEEHDEVEGDPATRPELAPIEEPDDVEGDPKARPALSSLEGEQPTAPRARPILPPMPPR